MPTHLTDGILDLALVVRVFARSSRLPVIELHDRLCRLEVNALGDPDDGDGS